MTQPATPVQRSSISLRAVVSAIETLAAAAATIIAILHGQDTLAVLSGAFTAHGVNHNVGGSPI